MELDDVLQAHAFMRVERPPELWEADTEIEAFLHMLGEMIVVGLNRGNELADLILNASNVTVEPDPDGESRLQDGDYVAISVRGAGEWADDVWWAGQGPTTGLLCNVGPAADAAGVVYAYARDLGPEGSVTVFLPRLPDAS